MSNIIWVITLGHDISTPTLWFHGNDYIKPRYIHTHPHTGLIIRTLYFHSRENLKGWIYRNVIFSFPTIFGGGDDIVTLYFHRWQYLVKWWIYRVIMFSLLTIFGQGVIISWHYIFTPDNIWSGGDYIVTLYFHSWQYLVRGWLYRDIIFSLLTIFGQGVIISWHYIFTPGNIWSGGDYIVTLYFHSWQYLVRGWLYREIIFSLLTIFGQGVIISWHYIFTPDNIWCGDDYIVKLYFHSWQYLVRGWLYRDIIFSLLTIFGAGVIISWHYPDHIFTPDDIWCGGEYIVTLYFHCWQYLVRGWLYHDTLFSPLTLFGQWVIISWHHIFTSDNIWSGGDYIVKLYFHCWQSLRIREFFGRFSGFAFWRSRDFKWLWSTQAGYFGTDAAPFIGLEINRCCLHGMSKIRQH